MRQQSFFAPCANAWDLVKWGCCEGFGAFGAMGANGKAVGLVAQALDKIQHWIIVAQGKRALPDAVKFFFALIAVNAFGDADHWQVLNAELTHNFGHSTNLTCTAVNQQQIRPWGFVPVGIVF